MAIVIKIKLKKYINGLFQEVWVPVPYPLTAQELIDYLRDPNMTLEQAQQLIDTRTSNDPALVEEYCCTDDLPVIDEINILDSLPDSMLIQLSSSSHVRTMRVIVVEALTGIEVFNQEYLNPSFNMNISVLGLAVSTLYNIRVWVENCEGEAEYVRENVQTPPYRITIEHQGCCSTEVTGNYNGTINAGDSVTFDVMAVTNILNFFATGGDAGYIVDGKPGMCRFVGFSVDGVPYGTISTLNYGSSTINIQTVLNNLTADTVIVIQYEEIGIELQNPTCEVLIENVLTGFQVYSLARMYYFPSLLTAFVETINPFPYTLPIDSILAANNLNITPDMVQYVADNRRQFIGGKTCPNYEGYYNWHFRNDLDYAEMRIALPIAPLFDFVTTNLGNYPLMEGIEFSINGFIYPYTVWKDKLFNPDSVGPNTVRLRIIDEELATNLGTDWNYVLIASHSITTPPITGAMTHTLRFKPSTNPYAIGGDQLICCNSTIQLSTTVKQPSLFVGFRPSNSNTSSHVNYPYSLNTVGDSSNYLGINSLNTAINNRQQQEYCLHFKREYTGDFPTGTPLILDEVPITYSFTDHYSGSNSPLRIVEYAGEPSQYDYSEKLTGNSIRFLPDAGHALRLDNMVPGTFQVGKPLLFYFEFYSGIADSSGGANYSRASVLFGYGNYYSSGISIATNEASGGFGRLTITFSNNLGRNWVSLEAPLIKGYNQVLFYYNGGNLSNKNSFILSVNGNTRFQYTINNPDSIIDLWNVQTVQAYVGMYFHISHPSVVHYYYLKNNTRIHTYEMYTGGNIAPPNNLELRTLFNDKQKNPTRGYYYRPNPLNSEFYYKLNTNNTGSTPVTAESYLNGSIYNLTVFNAGPNAYIQYLP